MTFDQLSLFDCEPQQPSAYNETAHSGLVGVVEADGHRWFGKFEVHTSTGQILYGRLSPKRARPKPVRSTCQHCGVVFHFNNMSGDNLGKFCSHACSCAANQETILNNRMINSYLNNPLDRCFSCGQWFRPEDDNKNGGKRITCSVECGGEFRSWSARLARLGDPWVDAETCNVAFNNCKSCDVLFTAQRASVLRCAACADDRKARQRRKNQKLQRKRRRDKGIDDRGKNKKRHAKHGTEYDTSITARKVAERDLMICQICGDTVERHLGKGWQPKGWSVGHIVPVSKGGSTTWDNVQCECMGCNVEKGVNIW